MSNKDYFDKLIKDLDYIQQNAREAPIFSRKVAQAAPPAGFAAPPPAPTPAPGPTPVPEAKAPAPKNKIETLIADLFAKNKKPLSDDKAKELYRHYMDSFKHYTQNHEQSFPGLTGSALVAAMRNKIMQEMAAKEGLNPVTIPAAQNAQPASPASAPVVSPAASPIPTPEAKAPTPPTGKHLITPGETLSGIAKSYGTTWQELQKLNPKITNPDVIRAGDTLNVPGGVKPTNAPAQHHAPKQNPTTPAAQPTQQAQPAAQPTQVPAEAPATPTTEPEKRDFAKEFKGNISDLVNRKNLGETNSDEAKQAMNTARSHLKEVADTGGIAAYTQALRYLGNNDILGDVSQHYRAATGSKKGMLAEDLRALNQGYFNRQYKPGDVKAISALESVVKSMPGQDGANMWQQYEPLLLALRKLVISKAKEAGVDLGTAQNA